jgi:hypothetical protein
MRLRGSRQLDLDDPAPIEAVGERAAAQPDDGNAGLLATDAVGGLLVRDRSGRWHDVADDIGTFQTVDTLNDITALPVASFGD